MKTETQDDSQDGRPRPSLVQQFKTGGDAHHTCAVSVSAPAWGLYGTDRPGYSAVRPLWLDTGYWILDARSDTRYWILDSCHSDSLVAPVQIRSM